MWWIIVVAIIAIPIVLFLRWGLSLRKGQKEIERVGGIETWSKNIDDQIAKNNERTQRGNERNLHSDETIRRNDVFSNTLTILEKQLGESLFSDVELEEITKDRQRSTNLLQRSTQITEQTTKSIEKGTKLIEKRTTLINKPISKANTEKIRALDTEIAKLDAEVEAADKQVIACDEELFASYAKIEQWVELGKTREAK